MQVVLALFSPDSGKERENVEMVASCVLFVHGWLGLDNY